MKPKTIWFDIDNLPHVWILKPLIEHVRTLGHLVVVTSRGKKDILDMCALAGLHPEVVDASLPGHSKALKLLSTIERGWRLRIHLQGKVADLAISHGSRAQAFAAWSLGIPSVTFDDYEHSFQGFVRFNQYLFVPDVIDKSHWNEKKTKIVQYPGFKELLYLPELVPDRERINIEYDLPDDKVIVVFRPEALDAHYRSDKTAQLQDIIIQRLAEFPCFVIALARTERQRQQLSTILVSKKIQHLFPQKVSRGVEIISSADLVIGGGGTMTREAAVLGVPSYSFFSGKTGAVDRALEKMGRLIMIRDQHDVRSLMVEKRKVGIGMLGDLPTRQFIIAKLTDIIAHA